MKLLLALLQILMLSAGFSSNRADAMAGAAAFSVLLVVGVALGSKREGKSTSALLRTGRK